MAQLTPRERQVATLVARGLSNNEVAHQLRLSRGTVKLHMHRILQKLGARSRYAMLAEGLVPTPNGGDQQGAVRENSVRSISAEINGRPLGLGAGDMRSRDDCH
jgi:DNA-binding CsgD family transcriptional regulator